MSCAGAAGMVNSSIAVQGKAVRQMAYTLVDIIQRCYRQLPIAQL